MNPFTYTRAGDAQQAINAFQGSPGPFYVAGATDVMQLLREDVYSPGTLVDISSLPYTQVEVGPRGARIGALARLADVADDDAVLRYYPLLARVLRETASTQIRNVATMGGNLLQRTRCLYFRDAHTACNKRRPGSGCAAMRGANRINAILGTSEQCIAAYPGDMAVALVVLDAHIQLEGPDGPRSVPVAELHRVPADDPAHDTTLRPGEIITRIDLPASRFAESCAFVKARDRMTFEWALASAAVGLEMDGGTVRVARVAAGGVGTVPWPLPRVEHALIGKALSAERAAKAAALSVEGARSAGDNGFKLKLLPRVVEQAILAAGGQA
ncbi:MAG TPA: FAD binding domain-containing protein [Rhodopila sp.]|uniref:FAD binding domain-containing protein n=1 Tax=Rhodopila sp. TaxID=2480087 RepID=UPI002B969718|nr:FAD binding domain-containing protein [Rhodopila sp.]HVY13971.1 FAD binding domain-containing protein [Rhodopila sp.]